MTNSDVLEITKHVGKLEGIVEERFREVRDRLDRGDQRFDELDSAISQINTCMASQQAVNSYRKEERVRSDAVGLVKREEDAQFQLQRRGKVYEMKLVLIGGLLSIAASGGVQLLVAYLNHRHP